MDETATMEVFATDARTDAPTSQSTGDDLVEAASAIVVGERVKSVGGPTSTTMPPPALPPPSTSSDWTSSGPLSRIVLADLDELSPERLRELWADQDRYVDQLEGRHQEASSSLREMESKLRTTTTTTIQLDPAKRDQMLVVRLAAKELEIHELSAQIEALKAAQAPSGFQMKSTLVDPAINVIIQKLKQELDETKKKMQETQEELSAWKFTPDSATGKRLMAKCRQLLQENEDIGKMISSGRLAKLENELAMQKALCEEMKKNQEEMDDFVQELDLDVEGMQSTIFFLQQQLKESKETIASLEKSAGQQTVAAVAAVPVAAVAKVEAVEEEEEEDMEQISSSPENEKCNDASEEASPSRDTEEPMDHQVQEEPAELDSGTPTKEEMEDEEKLEPPPSLQEEEDEQDHQPLRRGRRGKATSASAATTTTPKKESPRRGRSTRGQKRGGGDATDESLSAAETTPTKSPGRPKRTRGGAASAAADQGRNLNAEEENEEGIAEVPE